MHDAEALPPVAEHEWRGALRHALRPVPYADDDGSRYIKQDLDAVAFVV
jgi:hypothetical protein